MAASFKDQNEFLEDLTNRTFYCYVLVQFAKGLAPHIDEWEAHRMLSEHVSEKGTISAEDAHSLGRQIARTTKEATKAVQLKALAGAASKENKHLLSTKTRGYKARTKIS